MLNLKIFNKVIIFFLMGLRPLLGPATCKYPIGCTQYAIDQLNTPQSIFLAFYHIGKRVLSCNPFTK